MMDKVPYDVILDNIIVKNLDILFTHDYDIDGFLSLKLISKQFYRIINEEKVYKEIFRLKKSVFFYDSYSEFKEARLRMKPKRNFKNVLDYKLRILYKVAKINTWYFPIGLKESFGGFNNIIKIPVKHGISHKLLDGFYVNNFWKNYYMKMRHPIMRGVDSKGRNFIMIKYYDLTNKKEIIEVFFNNTLHNQIAYESALSDYINITYLRQETEYDYWEYNGRFGYTYIGDYFFECKKNVRQMTNYNYRLIGKLLKNETVIINKKYYDTESGIITTQNNLDNSIKITLDRLLFVRKCIRGLSN